MLLILLLAGCIHPRDARAQEGEVYEIRADRRESSATFSSTDRDTLIERVIKARDGGLELEYDLPGDVPARDRARTWQYPIRVFKPARGPLQLLNRSELDIRIDGWLKAANLPRAACGKWYFTWNAFRVECDPNDVLSVVERLQLTPDDLHDGALYRNPQTVAPAALSRTAGDGGDETYVAALAVDPEIVRRQRAEDDVVAGELARTPVTLETALGQRSAERIAGTMTVTLVADQAGQVRRRTTVTNLQITEENGQPAQQTVTETVVRQRKTP